ncbi:MAG: LysR family transcriptional regulator [Steroidobacteraceae bacterium]
MNSALDLSALTALAHSGRERSFTDVARRMGITPSAVSKAIARLEQQVGAKLVTRNSRSMALTPEGAMFHARCHELLTAVEEAKRAITHQSSHAAGRLRVSLPEGFGPLVIAPRLSEFTSRYPDIELEVFFTDQRLEFIDSNIDIAVWTGALPPSRLVARPLVPLQFVTCASPAYLATHGQPRTIEDLAGHVRLGAIAKRTGQLQSWRFLVDNKFVEFNAKPKIQSDCVYALVRLAMGGAGIAQVTGYAAADAVSKNLLVPILTEYSGASTPLNIVYPANARKLSRVQAFAQFVSRVVNEHVGISRSNATELRSQKEAQSRPHPLKAHSWDAVPI